MNLTVLRRLLERELAGRPIVGHGGGRPVESLEPRLFLSVTTVEPFSEVDLAAGQSSTIDLNDIFNNPGVDDNTVFMNTTLGAIPVELTPAATPQTVANFLGYADSGAYNGTFVHRSVPGFVWQSGGYTYNADANPAVQPIQAGAAVPSEYSSTRPNVTGTIAMALSDDSSGATDPNSGTDQFFFNLADNSGSLDPQGFTVFGSVVGAPGLAVMNAIANQQVVDASSDFPTLPVVNYTDGGSIGENNLIFINSITHNFTIQNSDPSVATVSEANSVLTLTASTPGTTAITVSTEGLDGSTDEQSFDIVVGTTATAKVGKGGRKSIKYVDEDTSVVTVSLSGPGTATLGFEGSIIVPGKGSLPYSGLNLHLAQITLTGTTEASTLRVLAENKQVVTITSITSSSPLGAVDAPNVALNGTLTDAGALRNLSLSSIIQGGGVRATSLGKATVSVDDLGDLNIAGAISSVSVGSYLQGNVSATSINTLQAGFVKDAQITLSSPHTSLNVLRADNGVDSTIVAQGNINSITFYGGVASTDIFAGIDAATAGSLPAAAAAAAAGKGSINSLTLGKGYNVDDFGDSAVAAGTLRRVSTGSLDDLVPSTAAFYGFAAGEILSFRGYVGVRPVSLAKVSTEAELQAQLTKQKFTLSNLTIKIV